MLKRNLLLAVYFVALCSSNIFAKSRIIITGKSSIIIESSDNNTNLIAGTIETFLGGVLNRSNFQTENGEIIIGDNSGNGLPNEFVIEDAYPNPFNPTTRIRYGLSTPSAVNVAIYDMTGRLVSKYKIGDKAPGWHEFTWQGNDSHGQRVSTGMYLVTMRAGNSIQKQKVTFLK